MLDSLIPLSSVRMTTLPIGDVVSFASIVIMEKSCNLVLLDSSVCCRVVAIFCSAVLPSMNVGRYAFPIISELVPIHMVMVMELYFVLLHVSADCIAGPMVCMFTNVHSRSSISPDPSVLKRLCSNSA